MKKCKNTKIWKINSKFTEWYIISKCFWITKYFLWITKHKLLRRKPLWGFPEAFLSTLRVHRLHWEDSKNNFWSRENMNSFFFLTSARNFNKHITDCYFFLSKAQKDQSVKGFFSPRLPKITLTLSNILFKCWVNSLFCVHMQRQYMHTQAHSC